MLSGQQKSVIWKLQEKCSPTVLRQQLNEKGIGPNLGGKQAVRILAGHAAIHYKKDEYADSEELDVAHQNPFESNRRYKANIVLTKLICLHSKAIPKFPFHLKNTSLILRGIECSTYMREPSFSSKA